MKTNLERKKSQIGHELGSTSFGYVNSHWKKWNPESSRTLTKLRESNETVEPQGFLNRFPKDGFLLTTSYRSKGV